jgi:signal transduction histidine kinase
MTGPVSTPLDTAAAPQPRVIDAPSRRLAEGGGLAHTIAGRLREARGGRIAAECAPGGGLRIVFTIPRAGPRAAA